jgi:hypothetical protein
MDSLLWCDYLNGFGLPLKLHKWNMQKYPIYATPPSTLRYHKDGD